MYSGLSHKADNVSTQSEFHSPAKHETFASMPNFNDFVYESAKSESTIRISQQLLASYLLSSDYLMMPHLRKSLYFGTYSLLW